MITKKAITRRVREIGAVDFAPGFAIVLGNDAEQKLRPSIVANENTQNWPDSESVTIGSKIAWDSGNANATVIGDTHYVSYYSGKAPDTSVMMLEIEKPDDS